MDLQFTSIAAVVRSELINLEGVTKFSPNRRFAIIYSEGSPADTLFFVESGLVKIYKRGEDNKEIILEIVSGGELFGDEALGKQQTRASSAEVLQEGVIYVIPAACFSAFVRTARGALERALRTPVERNRQLEKKIELLCLHDVEYRILLLHGGTGENVRRKG